MHIVSASRRTDIPAFYSKWLINRLRAKEARSANPFSGREYTVSLDPAEVAAIVLWSKDFSPLLPFLDEMDRMGHRLFFQFTITGHPRPLETKTPSPEDAAALLRRLSERYGPKAIIWRFDPILFSNLTKTSCIRKTFARLCRELEGATFRCTFSFVVYYRKLDRAVRFLSSRGVHLYEPTMDLRLSLAADLARIARDHGMELAACCHPELERHGVPQAACVDGPHIYKLFDLGDCPLPVRPTRKGCNCTESRDIGAYDTCVHGCMYCYANSHQRTAHERYERHDPEAERLDAPG